MTGDESMESVMISHNTINEQSKSMISEITIDISQVTPNNNINNLQVAVDNILLEAIDRKV
jgi:hypothetical protein